MSNSYTNARNRLTTGGLALFASHATDTLCSSIRNASLARKLGVRKINIRSQSFITGLECIRVKNNFDAGKGLWLEAIKNHGSQTFTPQILIGENVSVSFWCHIAAVSSITIGDHVMMGSKVLIIDHNHGSYGPTIHDRPDVPPAARPLSFGSIVIGDNVWIGDGVVITPNSNIQSGCVIGANAVVSGFIPRDTIAVGIPARPVKHFDGALQQWVPIP